MDLKALDSFIKLGIIFAHANVDENFKLTPAVRSVIESNLEPSRALLKTFGVPIRAFNTIVKDTLANKSFFNMKNEAMRESVDDYAKAVKDALPKISRNNKISSDHIALLRTFPTAILRSSEPAMARIDKLVGKLNDPALSSIFAAEVPSQSQFVRALAKFVNQHGGVGNDLSQEQVAKLTDIQRKAYNRLRTEARNVAKAQIRKIVRESGEATLPVSTVLSELKRQGVTFHPIPDGFVGNVDDSVAYYTKFGEKLSGTPVGEIQMNPDYKKGSSVYVLQCKSPMAAGWTRIYSHQARKAANVKKFEAADALAQALPKLRAKWLAHLRTAQPGTKEHMFACLSELIYLTAGRVSSPGAKTDGERTFGMTTLMPKHLKFTGSGLGIVYKGKSGQQQQHLLLNSNKDHKRIIEALRNYAKDKKPSEHIFVLSREPVRGAALNAYLRSIGVPANVTARKFRTVHGTMLAREALESVTLSPKASQAEIMATLKKQLKAVALKLGHYNKGELTITTALKNYIDPGVILDFFNRNKQRMPRAVEVAVKAAQKDL